jgi:membrane-bound lytic murein transglycosylase A
MLRRAGLLALGAAILILGEACETARREPVRPAPAPAQRPTPARPPPERPRPEPVRPAEPEAPRPSSSLLEVMGPMALPGWADADHLAAFEAFKAGCGVSRTVAMQQACNRARVMGRADAAEARTFFEGGFSVEEIPDQGVLTAYFAPQYEARRRPGGDFTMPVRPTPSDLRPGQTYATRTAIEQRPPNDALAWMRAEDLFFLQVQGSGTLVFEDGSRKKAVFAAHNSRPFQGIANPMRDRGLLAANNTSGDAIREWLAENRGPRADEIMRINPRYVFFRLEEDDGRDPAGAAGIPLPSGHAIAVDPAHHAYGDLYWIDGRAPILAGAFPTYQRLVMALDTGGAIRGRVRADLYLGKGDAAGREAGRVRHDLRMYRLVPRG